jgi:hypothetical protein
LAEPTPNNFSSGPEGGHMNNTLKIKLNVLFLNNFLRATHGVALKKHFGSWQSQLPNNFFNAPCGGYLKKY